MDSWFFIMTGLGIALSGLGFLTIVTTWLGFMLLNKLDNPKKSQDNEVRINKSQGSFLPIENMDFDAEWFNTHGTAKPLNTCDRCGNSNPYNFKIGLNGTTAECQQCDNIIPWMSKNKGSK